MTVFIASGTRWACPNCKRVQLFPRPIPQEALPVIIKCGFDDCKYVTSYSTLDADNPPIFPKLGPDTRVQGNWAVEMQEALRSRYWNKAEAEGQQISFRQRSEAIAGHLAGGLECIESLKFDLNNLADAMLAQFEGEWGILTNFIRFWNPGHANAFIKQPFLGLRTLALHDMVRERTRLVLHPKFFSPELGFFIPGLGGMLGQLITPYSQFSFPVERWMAALLDIPDPLQLRVATDLNGHSKIIGKHLFFCWADIPGTTPDADHLPDAPSIKITDAAVARRWLAAYGVPPWGAMPLERAVDYLPTAIQFFESCTNTYHRKAWQLLLEQGRIAYFVPSDEERISAWEFAMSVGAFGIGHKLCVITNETHKERYSRLWQETAGPTTMSRNFHWKVIKDAYDLGDIPWDSFRYLLVDFSDDLPLEICENIANFKGRVILIHTDPVMDTLDSNIAAAAFYSGVNGVFAEQRIPGSEAPFNYELQEHTLVSAMLREWKRS